MVLLGFWEENWNRTFLFLLANDVFIPFPKSSRGYFTGWILESTRGRQSKRNCVVFGQGMMFFPEFQQRERVGETERFIGAHFLVSLNDPRPKETRGLISLENPTSFTYSPMLLHVHSLYTIYTVKSQQQEGDLCDEKLKAIFDGKEKIGFLEIGKLLTRHFVKTDWPLLLYLALGFPTKNELAPVILNLTLFNVCLCLHFVFRAELAGVGLGKVLATLTTGNGRDEGALVSYSLWSSVIFNGV
ncbi:hypothetical protein SCA6_002759 [Theobroma cacao]